MKITEESVRMDASRPQASSRHRADGAPTFASALATATERANGPADFTRMTRREMLDWVNEEIRGGRMSVEEGAPFMGMTMRISVASGKPVEIATDTVRYDFMEKARLGIDGALSNHDQSLAQRLQSVLAIMQRHQGL